MSAAVRAAEPFDAARVAADLQRRVGVRTERDAPLAPHTTMRVGGPADLLLTVHNAFELRAALRFARARGIPHLVLGRGSDVVVADAGVRGLVILVRADGLDVAGERVTAEAGVQMARIATRAQAAGLTGLEFALAIPGSIGGAVWANAGAHDGEISAVIEWADVVGPDGAGSRLVAADLAFGYRDSRLKHPAAGSWPEVVVAAAFSLAGDDPAAIRARLEDIKAWRRAHQPLGIPSAGSVFRNPPGDSAGRLIDAAGLKGHRVGGAVVSERHANWILNDAKGTATDVRMLADLVSATVRDRFGVELV
ncbi:MAG: UDP-N-acetylmuramate dehydrogenase, partial [Chloroflexi bacterium]|nr:UDP-N-acetylmuramate dehydrogenase [Chloroflexota bacterium]